MRALLLLVVAGCGPLDGAKCESRDATRCDGAAAVAYCEATPDGGTAWRSYSCPAGCGADRCPIWRGVVVGGACPPSAGASWCDADGHFLVCSPNFSTTPISARWTEGPCMACRKDVPLSQTGNCDDAGWCRCQ